MRANRPFEGPAVAHRLSKQNRVDGQPEEASEGDKPAP